ncbi:MAG TPA: hypothetical protein VIG33_04080 [Pseudobdellovibrionaceae bacterium]|jgi:hypothetical protein
MRTIPTFKKIQLSTKPSTGSMENILTPVNLSGIIVPWNKALGSGRESDFKLVCSNGHEYFMAADSEWRQTLPTYCWEEVKVIGLLNLSNMTLIPQKIFPKGPRGEMENLVALARGRGQVLARKLVKNINDLVIVPAAIWAVMAF